MSEPAGYHPFLHERIRADGLLQLPDLFAADEAAVAVRVLHAELIESALQLSDERVTEARLDWWVQTLLAQPERHPLTAGALSSRLPERAAAVHTLARTLQQIGNWRTPASMQQLWQQAVAIAEPCAALADADVVTLAVHGLLYRQRAGVAGPHNPGLCPLDLRARHQMAELPAPTSWPMPLRVDWMLGVRLELQRVPAAGSRFDRAQRALIELELERAAGPRPWIPARAGRGLRALWRAWRAARLG